MTQSSLLKKWGWFVAIWVGSVLALSVVAMILRSVAV